MAGASSTEKPDRFSSIIRGCFINPSLNHKLLRCPFAREWEFPDEPPLFSSSLGPSQPNPTQIFMQSLPEEQDAASFFTPPEQHRLLGQNSGVDLKKARVRVSDHQSSKIRDGDTLPDGEIGGNCARVEREDSDSEGEMQVDDNGEVKGKGLMQNESGKGCDQSQDNRNHRDGLGSSKIGGKSFAGVAGNRNGSGVNGDKGKGTSDKAFDEIDKFVYKYNNNAGGGGHAGTRGVAKRQLPASWIQGKEKGVGNNNSELDHVMKLLERVVKGGGGSDSGDVDFFATAKKQGIEFPRPRWWPPQGEGGK